MGPSFRTSFVHAVSDQRAAQLRMSARQHVGVESWATLTDFTTSIQRCKLCQSVRSSICSFVAGDADNLGAVTRTVLETMRTLFVWVADLALYYSPLGGSGKVGEQWDQNSWLQARTVP